MSSDPCSCDGLCPHGRECSGGHANFPESHWWPTCDDGCFQPAGQAFPLKYPEGHLLMVVSGCRHALGPGRPGEVRRALVEHARSCPDAVKPQKVTPRRS